MLIKRLLTAVFLVPLVIIATLKLDNSEFVMAAMLVLVIGSWEFSSLIKMRHWLAKISYVVALMVATYYLNQAPF